MMQKPMKLILILFCWVLPGILWSQSPKVGDAIVNSDGSVGIVFWIQPDGSRGWMVALEDLPGDYAWGIKGEDIPGLENTAATPGLNKFSRILQTLKDTSGYHHTLALRTEAGQAGIYAAQAVDFDNGWCLPSIGQLRTLYGAWGIIRNAVMGEGGQDLLKEDYWSASEFDKDHAWKVYCYSGEVGLVKKDSLVKVRPVRSFQIQALVYDKTLTYHWNTGDILPEVTFSPLADTDYQVWVENAVGCSATASRRVFVAEGEDKIIYASICKGEEYTENGFHVSEAGTWTRPLKGPAGCEVTVTLVLDVKEPVETVLNETICEGEIYSGNNFTAWTEGEYQQTWSSACGCDSVVSLYLKVNPAYQQIFNDTVCFGETYGKYGFVFPEVTESGVYTHHFSTAAGCDSVIILNMEVLPQSSVFFEDAVCSGSPYQGYGFALPPLTKDTVCTDTLINSYGCDSVVTLALTVHPSFHFDYEASVCTGKSFEGYGFSIACVTQDTFCRASYQTQRGCDSVVQLFLSVRPVYLSDEEEEICGNETYSFHGRELQEEGVYYDSLTTVWGCDSVYRLSLHVNPYYFLPLQGGTCGGVPYDFHGKLLTESGIYYDSLRTEKGCDSVYLLDLQVHPSYSRTIDTVICRGNQYIGEGFAEAEAGQYEQHLTTQQGCDSIIVLNLGVEAPFEGDLWINDEDCRVHRYIFRADCRNAGEVPVYQCNWSFGDGAISDGPSPLHVYPDSGRYQVKVVIATPAGCRTELQQEIFVPYYQEEIKWSSDRTEIGQIVSTVYFQAEEMAGMEYAWDFGDGETAIGTEVVHTFPIEQQEYYEVILTVSNVDECTVEQRMKIKVFPGTGNVPNTITPNGDGINDVFMKGYSLRIFDRNGKEVFRGDDGWDGTRNGRKVPDDTYFYELYYLTEEGGKNQTGYITVVSK